jgi:ABC-type glycerol-3-phosphate transport system substrate-binding protein
MKHVSKSKKLLLLFLCVCLLITSFSNLVTFAAPGDTLFEKVNGKVANVASLPEDVYYSDYLKANDKLGIKDYEGSNINLDIDKTVTSSQGNYIQDNAFKLGKKALVWNDQTLNSITWTIHVDDAKYYNIELDYLPIAGSTGSAQREVYIDNKKLFIEMNTFLFSRKWENDGNVWVNALKDQVRPTQKEVFGWTTTRLSDSQGASAQPLKFYLSTGTHIITIKYLNEPIAISQVRLVAPKQYQTYQEVLKDYKKAGYTNATEPIRIEGEDAVYKSDPALRIQSNTDPAAYPVSSGYTVYNTIGGAAWNSGNQSITWKATVKKSGLYKLAFRAYQQYTDGLPIYRQIAIDGEVPYSEFLCKAFKFSDWNYSDLTDGNNQPYLVYLKEGVREITMTVKNEPYTNIISQLSKSSYKLGSIIQNIIKITGLDPDVNFDYELDTKIPNLLNDLKDFSTNIDSQVKTILSISNKTPGSINNLLMIKSQIDKMIKDPFTISKGLNNLMDAQNVMATWITEFQKSPLLIDYMVFQSPNTPTVDYSSNIFQKFYSLMTTFVLSFSKDYSALGVVNNGKVAGKTINVWVSRTKEWASVLQNISDEEFTKQNNINIKMNIVPAGSFSTSGIILLAIASGKGPDVALGLEQIVPFEYGCRGSICDLTKFDGYKDVAKRFLSGMLVPFEYKDHVYALPETMDFSIMYYRKDILSNLQIEVPNTWADLYAKVLPTLKKNGMDFFYDGGFNTFLMQNGGAYYTPNGLKSGLDSPESFSAFKQFTDLYKIYNVPIVANFYTRFRSGQMPIGISSFNTFIQLTATAPDLQGKWDVAMLPGVVQADGQINRSYTGASLAASIFQDSKVQKESWEFLKWYTSAKVQTRYANEIVSTVGAEARWCSANIEAFDNLPWEANLKNVIVDQRKWYTSIPNVVGGYITLRLIENARVRVIVQNQQYRDSLEQTVKDINLELAYKNQEFLYRDEISRGKLSEKK